MCNWLFKLPTGSYKNDTLSVTITSISRASAYYMVGTSYTDDGIVSSGWAIQNRAITATYP